jgi:hypothetical protein
VLTNQNGVPEILVSTKSIAYGSLASPGAMAMAAFLKPRMVVSLNSTGWAVPSAVWSWATTRWSESPAPSMTTRWNRSRRSSFRSLEAAMARTAPPWLP